MDPSQVPPQSESLLQQAGQAFNAGDPLRACQLAEHALRLDPGHPEGHYLAGLAALAASRPAIALDHLREAVSRCLFSIE